MHSQKIIFWRNFAGRIFIKKIASVFYSCYRMYIDIYLPLLFAINLRISSVSVNCDLTGAVGFYAESTIPSYHTVAIPYLRERYGDIQKNQEKNSRMHPHESKWSNLLRSKRREEN